MNIPLLLCILAASWTAAPVRGQPPDGGDSAPIRVERIATAAGVADREPVGETKSFDEQTTRVFCWVKLAIAQPPAKIRFVWARLSGKEWVKEEYRAEVDLPAARWWSSRRVSRGVYKVSVESEAGEELASAEFEVGKHTYVLD
ncbi:MAG: hypothetical protein A3J82_06470 [Elusimicrobia bacterium RIFOXYA2_FULL_69_6]|nr:MAG: hypothetical protein A3J82_06470 [Elusimicrobia bacterium RIFOXYA2_FULL_69_6]